MNESKTDNLKDRQLQSILRNHLREGLIFIGLYQNGKIVASATDESIISSDNDGELPEKLLAKSESEYKQLGTELYKLIPELDKKFEHFEQGNLIRVIFDVEHGGFFYRRISQTYYLLGAVVIQGLMSNADREMELLLDDVKRYFGLPD